MTTDIQSHLNTLFGDPSPRQIASLSTRAQLYKPTSLDYIDGPGSHLFDLMNIRKTYGADTARQFDRLNFVDIKGFTHMLMPLSDAKMLGQNLRSHITCYDKTLINTLIRSIQYNDYEIVLPISLDKKSQASIDALNTQYGTESPLRTMYSSNGPYLAMSCEQFQSMQADWLKDIEKAPITELGPFLREHARTMPETPKAILAQPIQHDNVVHIQFGAARSPS